MAKIDPEVVMGVMEIVVTSKFTGRKFGHCLGLSCPVLGCVLVLGCGGQKKDVKNFTGPKRINQRFATPSHLKIFVPQTGTKKVNIYDVLKDQGPWGQFVQLGTLLRCASISSTYLRTSVGW